MNEELLLTDVNGKDTQKAIDDLEKHKLPSIFSYRQAYFVGAKAQLAQAKQHYEKKLQRMALNYNIIIESGKALDKLHRLSLFQLGEFQLHSGSKSKWKIDCDTLPDWEAIAYMIQEVTLEGQKFGKVIGIPTGGLKLAEALEQYATKGATLIVDDVLTTGRSMEEMKATCKGEVIGVVAFARNECPNWIRPLFSMKHRRDRPELSEDIDKILGDYKDSILFLDEAKKQILALFDEEKIRKQGGERIGNLLVDIGYYEDINDFLSEIEGKQEEEALKGE